jgi:hypothetical protein
MVDGTNGVSEKSSISNEGSFNQKSRTLCGFLRFLKTMHGAAATSL